MIGRCVSAEWLKLRKRPSVWVLATIVGAVILLFGYGFGYLFYTQAGSGEFQGMDPSAVLDSLLPAAVAENVLSILASFGAPVALVLGALAVGSEYGWRTVKTAATQRPGRGSLSAGRLVVLAFVLLGFVVLSFASGAVGSLVVALMEGETISPPAAWTVLRALGAGWLVMAAWCTLGYALATLFRGTGLAIGLGLVYLLVLETIVVSVPLRGRAAEILRAALLGQNGTALAQSFSTTESPFLNQGQDLAEPAQATLVLLVYLVALAGIGALIFRRREVP